MKKLLMITLFASLVNAHPDPTLSANGREVISDSWGFGQVYASIESAREALNGAFETAYSYCGPSLLPADSWLEYCIPGQDTRTFTIMIASLISLMVLGCIIAIPLGL